MASPVDANRIVTNVATAVDPWTINLPAGIVAGDLLVLYARGLNFNFVAGSPTGWTLLLDFVSSGQRDCVYYKWATGSEGTSLVGDAVAAAKGAVVVWRITGAADPATQPPELSARASFASGTANAANPASISPTGGSKDYLFLAIAGLVGETQTFAHAAYTNVTNANSGTGGAATTNVRTVGASRQATTATEDPAAFTHAAADGIGSAYTIAIHPAGAAGTAHTVPINDTLSVSDSATPVKLTGHARTVNDTLALADVFTRATATQRTVADTFTLTDARAFARGKAVTDALTLADLLVAGRSQAVPLADVLALADAVNIAWLMSRPQSERVNLADSFTRVMAYGRTQADGLTLIDSTRDAQGIRLGDVVLLVDQLTRAVASLRTITDTLALTDLASPVKTVGGVAHTRPVADAIALTDQLTRAVAKARALADTIALTDQLARATTKARTQADSVALADARRIAQGQALADAVALTDQLTRIAPRIRTFTDTVLLSDAVLTSKTGAGQLNPADLVQIADSFTRIATYGRLLADTVALTDARSLGRGKRVTDQVLLADLLARATGKSRLVNDLIALTDHVITSKVTGGYVLNYATDIRWGAIQADRVLVGVDEVWTP